MHQDSHDRKSLTSVSLNGGKLFAVFWLGELLTAQLRGAHCPKQSDVGCFLLSPLYRCGSHETDLLISSGKEGKIRLRTMLFPIFLAWYMKWLIMVCVDSSHTLRTWT